MEALSALQKALRALTRPHNYARGANLQEHADLLRLYMLTGAREGWPNPMPPPDLDSLPPPRRQREVVHERIYLQATTLLQRWHRERPSPLPIQNARSGSSRCSTGGAATPRVSSSSWLMVRCMQAVLWGR